MARALTITRIAKRSGLSPAEAAYLTAVAFAMATFGGIVWAVLLGFLGPVIGLEILPASPMDMTFEGFMTYALALSVLGWTAILLIDLMTDVGFRSDFDLAEIVFGGLVAGPIVAVALQAFNVLTVSALTQHLWLVPFMGLAYFSMKVLLGR